MSVGSPFLGRRGVLKVSDRCVCGSVRFVLACFIFGADCRDLFAGLALCVKSHLARKQGFVCGRLVGVVILQEGHYTIA